MRVLCSLLVGVSAFGWINKNPQWDPWGPWIGCSNPCGGIDRRSRSCKKYCQESYQDEEHECGNDHCGYDDNASCIHQGHAVCQCQAGFSDVNDDQSLDGGSLDCQPIG